METEQTKRENPEPSEMHFPLPWTVKLLMIMLTVWGAYYILNASHRPSEAGDHTLLQRPEASQVSTKSTAMASDKGSLLYSANCAACHQANGDGLAGVFPPLSGSSWVLGRSETLVQILLAGLTGPIEVLGVKYNGMMPAFSEQLSDDEIASVATYIRQSWGNTADPIDSILVKQLRDKGVQGPWTAQELVDAYPKQ